MNSNKDKAVKHSIAIIPGDGIGQEIMPEALKVLAWAEKPMALRWSCITKTGHTAITT